VSGVPVRGGTADALAVALGGAAGALARVALAEALPPEPGGWPWATLAANVAGTLLLAWLVRAGARGRGRLLLGPGLCGALTTFSALQLELVALLRDGALATAAGYAPVTLAAGLAAASLARGRP
jgi:CrcB protein